MMNELKNGECTDNHDAWRDNGDEYDDDGDDDDDEWIWKRLTCRGLSLAFETSTYNALRGKIHMFLSPRKDHDTS